MDETDGDEGGCGEESGDMENGDDVVGKEPKDESGEGLTAERDGEWECREGKEG